MLSIIRIVTLYQSQVNSFTLQIQISGFSYFLTLCRVKQIDGSMFVVIYDKQPQGEKGSSQLSESCRDIISTVPSSLHRVTKLTIHFCNHIRSRTWLHAH